MTSVRVKGLFGIGKAITQEDATITGNRLPSCRQVLRCYLYFRSNPKSTNQTKHDCAMIVMDQVLNFYSMGHIPTITPKKAAEKIVKLADKNDSLREIPSSRRTSDNIKEKLKKEEKDLDKTFKIWAKNAKQIINAEDVAFLKSMETDRKASFGARDMVLKQKVDRKRERQEAEARLVEKEKQRVTSTSCMAEMEADCVSDLESPNHDDPTDSYQPISQPGTSKCRKLSGTDVFVPPDILSSPRLAAMATRMKITPTRQAAYTKALIDEIGGHSSNVYTSYTYTHQHRKIANSKTTKKITDSWIAPQYLTLHWDSKLMMKLHDKDQREERLVVAVSTSDEMKVLGVPSYEPKAKNNVSEKIWELLNQWGCQQSIIAMTFDTTASNTGHLTAACIQVQQSTGKALLWTACRHHVGEIILSHVFEDLKIESSHSPEVSVFSRFKKNYAFLNQGLLKTVSLTSLSEKGRNLAEELRVKALHQCGLNTQLRRDDYKEVVDLCTLYLQHEHHQAIRFLKPGAFHKARWMAKLIYSFKLAMFEDEIAKTVPTGTITTKKQAPKIRAFTDFIALVYVPWWLTTSDCLNAPANDFDLYKRLKEYAEINPVVSASALRSFGRHLWYLTSELVPLSLFSPDVSLEERGMMANKLLSVKPEDTTKIPEKRYGIGFGKPVFPEMATMRNLHDLINVDSWLIFRLLELDVGFLRKPSSAWAADEGFQSNVHKVKSIVCVNDLAERGVKLGSDFLEMAKSEEIYQAILQVVEDHRKAIPDLRKFVQKSA